MPEEDLIFMHAVRVHLVKYPIFIKGTIISQQIAYPLLH